MENKKSVVTIMLLSSLFYGCSSKIEPRTGSNEVKMATSPYRISLSVLGKIDEKLATKDNSNSNGNIHQCIAALNKAENLCDLKKTALMAKIYKSNDKKLFLDLVDEYKNDGNISDSLMNRVSEVTGKKTVETKTYDKKTKKSYSKNEIDKKSLNNTREKIVRELSSSDFSINSLTRFFRVSGIKNTSADASIQNINLENIVKTALANTGENIQVIDGTLADKEYLISGSITGYDKVFSKRGGPKVNAYGGQGNGEFDIGMKDNNDDEKTEITLDLFVSKRVNKNASTKIVPKITSSNTLILQKTTNGKGFNLTIMGVGVSFQETVTFTDPLAYGTRLLVEKSLVELIAKMNDLNPNAFEIRQTDSRNFLWNEHLNKIYAIMPNENDIETINKKKAEHNKIKNVFLSQLSIKQQQQILYKCGYSNKLNEYSVESLYCIMDKIPQGLIQWRMKQDNSYYEGTTNASK
jgi:hypothetical protein